MKNMIHFLMHIYDFLKGRLTFKYYFLQGGEAEKEVEELEQADEINNDDELDSEDDQPSYDELRESLEKKRQMNRTLANIVNKQRMTYKENYEALEKQVIHFILIICSIKYIQ